MSIGDRVQLQQVILNLHRNASDAMNTVNDLPRELLIKTARDEGDRVRLSVIDAGVGFSPEAATKLFQAFYTTKRDGMGIGLSLSYSYYPCPPLGPAKRRPRRHLLVFHSLRFRKRQRHDGTVKIASAPTMTSVYQCASSEALLGLETICEANQDIRSSCSTLGWCDAICLSNVANSK